MAAMNEDENLQAAQIAELQNVVGALRRQILDMAATNETNTREIAQLKYEARQAPTSASSPGGGDEARRNVVKLIDGKMMKPDVFDGNRNKIRGWAMKVRTYANAMFPGMRRAMLWAEKQKETIDEDTMVELSWEPADQANAALFDMLSMITEGEALGIVLGSTGIEAGFEAWRQLMTWYDPCNAHNETDIVNQLISLKRVKEPKDIPPAIYSLEQ